MSTYKNARKVTKQKIMDAFWSLYRETPIGKITIKHITDICAIHRSTFYIHFTDVYAVLDEIETYLLQELENIKIEKTYTDVGLADLGKMLYELFKKDNKYLHLLLYKQRDPSFAKKYKDKLREDLRRLMLHDGYEYDPRQETIISIVISAIIETFIICVNDSTLSDYEMIDVLKGLMMNGCYITMKDKFEIEGLKNPFKSEYW